MDFGNLIEDSAPLVLFNTGTLYDLIAGSYMLGYDNKYYLNGGYGCHLISSHGKGNTYKSTLADSYILGLMKNYPGTHCFVFDTEHSKNKNRSTSFMHSPLFPKVDVANRYTLKAGGEWTIDKVFETIKQICKAKEANKAEQTVITPFVDYSGKRMSTWNPTIVFIDTLSELKSGTENANFEERDLEDKKNKMFAMNDGLYKTQLLSMLNKMCGKYGIIMISTAHSGKNVSLTNIPPSKALLNQRVSISVKGVGAKYDTINHVLLEIMSCKHCQDVNKTAMYKLGVTDDKDLQELQVITSRNKVQSSGTMVPFVVSQHYGLLNDVSNLNFLRANGYLGLDGGSRKPTHACNWLPDVRFSRNNIREKLVDNYPLARALELTARYRYIQLSWNLSKLPVDFSRTTEEIFDGLNKSSIEMKDILEGTTSNWTYADSKKQDKKTMTIFDVVDKIK